MPGNAEAAERPRELRDRLLDGTRDAIFRYGWDRTSVSKICGAVGLTSGAFYPRFADRVEAASALWVEWLGPLVVGEVEALLQALERGDEEGFVRCVNCFAQGSPELDVAVELLLAAQYDERLAEVVGGDLRAAIVDGCADQDRAVTASKMLGLILAFGLTMLRHRTWARGLKLDQELRRFFQGLTHPGPVLELPPVRADYLLHPRANSGDQLIDAFYDSGFLAVSEVGYAKANLKEICKRAGLTTGFLFSRHEGKLDFFLEVIRQGWKANIEKGMAFASEVAHNYGQLVADAVIVREFSHPDYRGQVRCNLEIQRLARFNDDAAELVNSQEEHLLEQYREQNPSASREYFATEMATGAGVILLSTLVPDLQSYDFVAPLAALLPA